MKTENLSKHRSAAQPRLPRVAKRMALPVILVLVTGLLGTAAQATTEPVTTTHDNAQNSALADLECTVAAESIFPQIDLVTPPTPVPTVPFKAVGGVFGCVSPNGLWNHLRFAYALAEGETTGCGPQFTGATVTTGRAFWNMTGTVRSNGDIRPTDFNGNPALQTTFTGVIGVDTGTTPPTVTATAQLLTGPLAGGTAVGVLGPPTSRGPDGAPNPTFCPSTGTIFDPAKIVVTGANAP